MKTRLSSPWVLFYRKIEAFFREDRSVRVKYDSGTQTIKVFVTGQEKADALTQLLPTERTFGSVTVKVEVIPANLESPSKLVLFQKAFDGNPALAYIKAGGDSVFDLNYVVFRGRVVQYRSDDIGDVNGLTSTLYQDLARDIFEDAEGIFFCTEAVQLT